MWNSICNDSRIGIKKSLLGLRTTATYLPTNSEISIRVLELSPDDGKRVTSILNADNDSLEKAIGDFKPKKVDIGNYMLEVCASADGAFVAMQLFQFLQLSYEPITGLKFYEGANAKIISKIF